MNTTQPAPTATEVDDMVRAAFRYLRMTSSCRWVGLLDLREALSHLTRDEVDASLRRLFLAGEANLVPESNQKALTDEDRRAAVHLGGEHKHLMFMEG